MLNKLASLVPFPQPQGDQRGAVCIPSQNVACPAALEKLPQILAVIFAPVSVPIYFPTAELHPRRHSSLRKKPELRVRPASQRLGMDPGKATSFCTVSLSVNEGNGFRPPTSPAVARWEPTCTESALRGEACANVHRHLPSAPSVM